jgi:hypothetical protein
MDRDTEDLYDLLKSKVRILTLSQLAGLAAQVLSPAARNIACALVEAFRGNRTRSRLYLKKAESSCTGEAELCYILHFGAMALAYAGDMDAALEKDKRSLDLCDRLGLKRLQADVLSSMSAMYGALGQAHLAAAYSDEADRMGLEGETDSGTGRQR